MQTRFSTNTVIDITPTADVSSPATFGLFGGLSVATEATGDEAFFVRTFYPEFVNYAPGSGGDDSFKFGEFPGFSDYGDTTTPVKDWNGNSLSLDTLKAIIIEVKPISAFQGTAASGVLSFATHPANGDTVTIGATTYTFRTSPTVAYDVVLGANKAAAITNLDAAILANGSAPTNYNTGTLANPLIGTSVISGDTIVVTAARTGLAGNLIATTRYSPSNHMTWAAATLTGGEDVTQPAVARTLEGTVKITLASALLPGAASSLIYTVSTPSLLTFAVPEGWVPDPAGMINIQFNSTGPAPLTDKDVNAVVTVALIGSST
jgi:hypothetical protein